MNQAQMGALVNPTKHSRNILFQLSAISFRGLSRRNTYPFHEASITQITK